MTEMTTSSTAPKAFSLALVPALITLAVTLTRLGLELAGAPGWMASSAPGGAAAILGIVWLPLVFGPYFASRLRPHFSGRKAFWLRLWKTLTAYGLMARLPVALLTIGAVLGDWGTHYETFPGITDDGRRIVTGFVAQLGFWACVWTPAVGLVAALVALAVRPREHALRAGASGLRPGSQT
jgi:hypothetical protein